MGKNKILIVDDEADLVELLKWRLEANNYEVITAFNGKQGLAQAREHKPDMIILDIIMPDMDGTSMAAALGEDKELKNIPIIFLTCLVEQKEDHLKGLEIAPNAFLAAKPFNAQELLAMIQNIFNKTKY